MSKNIEKIARICWNTENWRRPSGKEGKSKSDQAYENKIGYGHEEWLLDLDKIYDGYHYGFLQPMNVKSGIHVDNTYDIHLFTISPQGHRVYVGCLHNAIGVGPEESKKVYAHYKKNGWLKEMEQEVLLVTDQVKDFEPEIMFNVKFRIEDAITNDSNPPILTQQHITSRYVLQNKDFSLEYEKDKSGHKKIFNTKTVKYNKNSGQISYEPKHKKIQEALCVLLAKEYDNIEAEMIYSNDYGQRVDLSGVHKTTGEMHFFEIKTHSAKENIREALGQILEYAHYPAANRAKKLYIVGEIKPDKDDKDYLKQLRKLYNIPIWYRYYSFNDDILSDEY